tara:strand:- start:126 stop:362 length:237 start_codon:yes stop_codon:yes gene_type:complete
MKLSKREYESLINIVGYNFTGYIEKEAYETLIKIVDNGIDEELEHYKECSPEGRKNHIYNDYLRLSLAIKEIEMRDDK